MPQRRAASLAVLLTAAATVTAGGLGGRAAAAPGVAGPVARPAVAQVAPAAAAGLGASVRRAFAGLGRASVAGYAVVDGSGVVVDKRSTVAQPPASTEKLFTTGTALLTLGPAYRFSTTVSRTGAERGSTAFADSRGTLHGDLVLRGAGDPTLTGRNLDALAAAVAAAGVVRVTGNVWLDDTLLDRQRGVIGWHADYVGGESGPLSALMVDHNLWLGGAAFRANPSVANLGLFRADLLRHKVKVAGSSSIGTPPSIPVGTAPIATHTSAPLADILRDMDQRSDNTYAEMILKDIGAASGAGSTGGGANVVTATAASLGVTLGRFVDGSGLSTLDAESAQTEVAFLQAMDTTPMAKQFRSELPLSCATGTLASRLCGPARHRVAAKTGTLDYTSNLAGYTTTATGDRVWFAFLVDRVNVGAARAATDRAVTALVTSAL